ncbi:MAG: hypothetical protein WC967_12670 [Balneolaceae bacterium]
MSKFVIEIDSESKTCKVSVDGVEIQPEECSGGYYIYPIRDDDGNVIRREKSIYFGYAEVETGSDGSTSRKSVGWNSTDASSEASDIESVAALVNDVISNKNEKENFFAQKSLAKLISR